MSLLEGLLRAELAAFSLEVVRIAGLVLVAPLPWTWAPARVRAGLVLALALAGHSFSGTAGLPTAPEAIALAASGEFLLGAAIGFIVRMAVAVGEIAAVVIAPQMGLGVAQLFDPKDGASMSVLAQLFRYLAILLAVLVGVHRVVINALITSFQVFPVGHVPNPGLAFEVILRMSADILAAGVRIAIPMIAVLFMTQIALAFISRAAPAMQIFSVGFAVTLAVGSVVLVLMIPDTGYRLLAEFSRVGPQIESILMAMAGG